LKKFNTFEELNIPQTLKSSLTNMSFINPTPIQADAIPAGLEGKDIVGTAQTGTGKTGAFAIPMLSALYHRPGKLGLILAPTRELAGQIQKVMRQMSKDSKITGCLVVGGESFSRQANDIDRGVDYIVATPGRLNDHIEQRTVDLSKVEILVLDEVDRMLDMGFLPQIKNILRFVPKERQTLLFSATLPEEVQRFVGPLVKEPVRITVGDATKPNAQVKETIRRVGNGEKPQALLEELKARSGKVLVFVRTQSRTQRLQRTLDREGYNAVCLHGGRTQGQRKRALEVFRGDSNSIMIATDLAGRGLDINDVDHVINFDVPSTREDYIHRIGRTGRAERTGEAVSFVEHGNADEEKVVTGKRPNGQTNSSNNSTGSKSFNRPRRPGQHQGRHPRREKQHGLQTDSGRRSDESPRFAPRSERAQGMGERREDRNFRGGPRQGSNQHPKSGMAGGRKASHSQRVAWR
jgi:superfamily II DNA/RNA helicase